MDVGPLGRMAIYSDPAGAFFGVWQAGEHTGAEVTDSEGTFTWVELSTRNQTAALPFYEALFGWTPQVSEGYTEFQLGGTSIAGCMDMPDMVPAEVPSYWMPYFAASDPDAQATKAGELGGTVLVPGQDFPGGRFAVVQDPNGATFGLLALKG
jgi:predicted enzyme related to lactoylglutathione lyase